MKTPLIVSLVALAFSVLALAATLVGPRSSTPREVASAQPTADGPDAALLARVDALADENRELRTRLSMLEGSLASAQRTPVTDDLASMEELDAFRDEVREALASPGGIAGVASVEPDEFKEQVADTIAEIRREETVGKFRASQEKRLERLDETMPKIEEWLELTPHQSDEMRSALLLRHEREAELLRLWEEGADPEVLGEQKASDHAAFQSELAGFLTAEQVETYLSSGWGSGK